MRNEELLCRSGRHAWLCPECRRRCCNGYVRVQDTSRAGLEEIGAEHIKLAQRYRGWRKEVRS